MLKMHDSSVKLDKWVFGIRGRVSTEGSQGVCSMSNKHDPSVSLTPKFPKLEIRVSSNKVLENHKERKSGFYRRMG